jgi:hypothetical protein
VNAAGSASVPKIPPIGTGHRAGDADVHDGHPAQHGRCGEEQHQAQTGEQGPPATGVGGRDPERRTAPHRHQPAE